MNRNLTRLGFTALALVAGVVAQAQTATTGSITGVVRDASGNPLAGATVYATSAQITRTATTGADGSYRLSLLNPGEWSIKASKGGQSAPSQKTTVLVNNSSALNFKLASEASAVVTVVAASAAMDITTAQTGSVLQMEQLSAVPMARDFNNLVSLAPGTQSGGLMGGNSISGSSAIENNFIIDGLDTTDYRKGFQGASMPTDFFDQVEVQTGGFRPEFSALGGVVNAITKSGTNQFVGSAWITSDMAQLAGKQERNYYYIQAPPSYRYDYGFTAGGAILPDKLFYFVGANMINVETLPSTNAVGLTTPPATDKTTNIYGKLNYYIAEGHQLTATFNTVSDPVDYNHYYPTRGNRDTGYSSTSKNNNFSLNYDWNITSNLLLSAKYGSTSAEYHLTPVLIAPSITDYMWYGLGPGANTPGVTAGTAFIHGGTGDWTNTDKADSKQFKVDLSWYLGDHFLKFGVAQNSAKSTFIDLLAGDDRVSIVAETRPGKATPLGELRYITVTTYANLGSSAKLEWSGFYAQDQWEVSPGLRLAYGVRYEEQTVKGNGDRVFVKFNNFSDQLQPRLGLTWDVNRDGKTKFSANFAIYEERFPMQAALRTGGNETYVQKLYYGPYYAALGYHAGATYNKATGAYAVTGTPDSVSDYSGYFRDDPQPLDGLKVPKKAEYILGLDHTFPTGWTAGVHAKYRKTLRIVEDTVPTDAAGNPVDGEGFSILWNPQAGKTYQWRNNQYHSNPGGLNTWVNTVFPDPKNNYSSVDVTLDKKTDKYTLSLNYTLSHLYGNYEGVGQSSNGQADANITSTWDYFPYIGNGNLSLDRRHMLKAYGSYNFDLFGNVLALGGKLIWQSGLPKSYFDNTNDLGGYGNATPEYGMYGTRGRLPSTAVFDTHIEYQYRVSSKVKVVPTFDIFNTFNSRTQTSWDQFGTTAAGAPNPAFSSPNGWLAGRNYRWGVKVNF